MSFTSGILVTAAERAALLGLDRPQEPALRRRWPAPRSRPADRQVVSLRLDGDVLDWFRRDGGGDRALQSRINAALRAHMADHDDGR